MFSTLGHKIGVVLAVPVIALTALSASSFYETMTELADIERKIPLINAGQMASSLIHELQKERGRVVGMITADYAAVDVQAVDDQRVLTDQVRAQFEQQLDMFAQAGIAESRLASVTTALDKLGRHRNEVDAQTMDVEGNIGYYTDIVRELLMVMGEAVRVSPSKEMAAALYPVYHLATAKEQGGLERALGGALLNDAALGEFSLAAYVQYHNRLAGEEFALGYFREVASPAQLERFESVVAGQAVDQVIQWRQLIAGLAESIDPRGVSGKAWFDMATKRIDLFKQVEDELTAEAKVLAQNLIAVHQRYLVVLVAGLVLVIGMVLTLSMALLRYITRNVDWLRHELDQFATVGTTSLPVEGRPQVGEFGDLARSLGVCIERRQRSNASAASLNNDVGESVRRSVHANQQLDSLAKSVVETIDATNETAAVNAKQFRDTSEQLQGLAAASAEMAASIDEIRSRMEQSVVVGQQAGEQTGKTKAVVTQANDAALKIGNVLSVIDDLAEQTNLLALNATIEAARAGDAGRGFAVVASEVKSLANQTMQATSTIGGQIKALQAAAEAATVSIDGMVKLVDQILDVQSSIAVSINQQSAVTNEVSQIAARADGTMEIGLKSTATIGQQMSKLDEAAAQLSELAASSAAEAEQLKVGNERLAAAFA